jgi:DNA-binding Lrp family transcriptional regulator
MASSSASGLEASDVCERILVRISPGEVHEILVPESLSISDIAQHIHQKLGLRADSQTWIVENLGLDAPPSTARVEQLEQEILQLRWAVELERQKFELRKADLSQPSASSGEQAVKTEKAATKEAATQKAATEVAATVVVKTEEVATEEAATAEAATQKAETEEAEPQHKKRSQGKATGITK